jgi:MFS family permease
MPLAMALLSAALPLEERARALGIFSGLIGLALVASPVVGGAITPGLDWRWIFWLKVPIGLIAIPARAPARPRKAWDRARLSISLASGL